MRLCDDNGQAVKSSKEGLTWTNGQLSLAPNTGEKAFQTQIGVTTFV